MTGRLFLGSFLSIAAAVKPAYVIHIVADDLGYNDVGYRNGQSQTPNLDKLVAEGVEIPEFYVYKMCAPSRGSILTGRYPMHLGMYNNNGLQEGIHLGYTMLPALLKQADWSTHALGKWHLGWFNQSYLPTGRGFDTFFGASGNTADYWDHTISGPQYKCTDRHGVEKKEWRDFIDCSGTCSPSDVAGDHAFGEYDARVLTKRAVQIVQEHDVSKGLYIYLAYHNVHMPAEAPCDTVSLFGRTEGDMRKVIDASLLELDYGIGNVSQALTQRSMLESALWIFHTDNGGPTSHACNYPHRGGKFSFWEGGVRGMAAVSGGLIPKKLRGTTFQGIAHLSDWYATITEGIADVKLPTVSGPVPPASVNLWPALTSGHASPRTEVLHLPLPNKYVNTTVDPHGNACTDHGCSPSLRVGDYKLIQGWPGSDGLCHLKPLLDKPVPYGHTKGNITGNRCSGGKWDSGMTSQNATCVPFCLFNVKEDPSEERDLSASQVKEHVDALRTLNDRLKELSASGMPVPDTYDKQTFNKIFKPMRCDLAESTGFWLPLDWKGPIPPTPPPPPTPGSCEEACEQGCPLTKFGDFDSCLACTRQTQTIANACKPKERRAYCSAEVIV